MAGRGIAVRPGTAGVACRRGGAAETEVGVGAAADPEAASAAALTAVLQLHARHAIEPDELIVVVLTSGGLKDPGASRTWMHEVPTAPDNLDGVLAVLEESYGLELGG